MAIPNRALDASEQKRTQTFNLPALATGTTVVATAVPFASTIAAAACSVTGVSGTPTLDLRVYRMVVGVGLTSWSLGATVLTPAVYGTSGLANWVIASSLAPLQANDVIGIACAGSNSNVLTITGGVVLQALQDIKTQFGA